MHTRQGECICPNIKNHTQHKCPTPLHPQILSQIQEIYVESIGMTIIIWDTTATLCVPGT